MSGKRDQKSKAKAKADEAEKVEAKDIKNEELDQETEDLLADIDGILEENAEEFVRGYIQKGGQ